MPQRSARRSMATRRRSPTLTAILREQSRAASAEIVSDLDRPRCERVILRCHPKAIPVSGASSTWPDREGRARGAEGGVRLGEGSGSRSRGRAASFASLRCGRRVTGWQRERACCFARTAAWFRLARLPPSRGPISRPSRSPPGPGIADFPTFSPDGQPGRRSCGTALRRTISTSTSKPSSGPNRRCAITTDPAADYSPAWSPDVAARSAVPFAIFGRRLR